MAIAKIKAIRNRSGKKRSGIKNSADYILNEEKTTTTASEAAKPRESDEDLDIPSDGKSEIDNVVDYAMNPDKTEDEVVKLVSGHNCNPATAAEEMNMLCRMWKEERRMMDNEKDAYHLIQSFDPKDNDKLTYEMAHQIGLDMCRRIEGISDVELKGKRRYKMLVCTHIDRRHIHNHILFCPYDIDTGYKYHDNKITYAKIRQANDELCKEYGLSIIIDPDNERKNSYKENMEIKNGTSWKEDFRRDIDAMKAVCNDWNTFVLYMEAAGYKLKQGKHITYEKDDHKVRDNTLGREWTKESIEQYWREMEKEQEPIKIQNENYYFEPKKRNSKTKKLYKVNFYDEDGRRRSNLEMILLLAFNVIDNEGDAYNTRKYSSDNPIYAKKDYKLQNMMDAIATARKENISSIEQIEEKLNDSGKKLSHYKLELKKNNATLNKMEIIKNAIKGYEAVKDTVEMINALEDGPAKESIKAEHKTEIDEYKKNKAILYRYKCASDEQIADFDNRYQSVKNNIANLEDLIKSESGEYAKLKKLQNSVELAQNQQFCYGPEYMTEEEIEEQSQEQEREKEEQKQNKAR